MLRFDLDEVREIRGRRPEAIAETAARRRRRPLLGDDGRLLIVAADHPARGALGVGRDPWAMADRAELLRRLAVCLARPGVDGVLATPDVLEDLLLLGALEGKVVFASMNRGGLQGAAFELDDRFTAADAGTIAAMGFDGGKMLCRIDPSDPGSLATLEACAQAITALAARELTAMVEPFMSRVEDGRVRNVLTTEAVIRSVAITGGLGATSARTWLKLPVVDDMEAVMAATTLPTLLLGGDPAAAPTDTLARWEKALRVPGVRGLVIGRALLYPPDGHAEAVVDRLAELVHPAAGAVAG